MSRSPRSRSKTTENYISYVSGGTEYSALKSTVPFEIFDDFLSSNFRSFNPCLHIDIKSPFSGKSSINNINFSETHFKPYFDMSLHKSIFDLCFTRALSEVNVQADFQKNNSFELLNLIAELDDLIATFTLKFLKTLNYGSVNWGILPLISDIRSLKNSFDDIFGGRFQKSIAELNSRKALSFTIELDGEYGTPSQYTYKFKGTLRLRGDLSTSLPSTSYTVLQTMLDELGVHPDLKTVWDIIPFSFVLDYFLPIGDLLESIHPRGWLDLHLWFSGNASLTGKLTIVQKRQFINNDFYFGQVSSESRCYERREGLAFDPRYNKPPLQDYKFGLSLRQLFNLAYLSSVKLK